MIGSKVLVVLLFGIGVLYLYRLVVESQLGMKSDEYFALTKQIKEIDAENTNIKSAIADNESLARIEQVAKLGGFQEARFYFLGGGE